MEEKHESAIFASHFNLLIHLGVWKIDTENPAKKLLYYIYSVLVSFWILFMVYMGVLDLMASLNEINKIFYNACFNPLIFATWIKLQQIVWNARRIMTLHRKLRRSAKTCKDAKEVEIYLEAEKTMKSILRLFYIFVWWSYPAWFFISMVNEYWGERGLPLPAKWPNADIGDLQTFILVSVYHGIFAIFFIFLMLSLDLSMFGLLIEINREYYFLIKRVEEFNEYCEDIYTESKDRGGKKRKTEEINIYLKKEKAKQMLGEIILRQKELLGFTEEFEKSYSAALFTHIFVGGALLVTNGVQAMIVSSDYNMKMAYQFGYLLALMFDMLNLCTLTDEVSTRCCEVGTAFYSSCWYKMDVGIQKDIFFVLLRTQKPPRITSGNFLELNRRALMVMLKNIYSWLALLRQVALK